jgi:hypothetical protein
MCVCICPGWTASECCSRDGLAARFGRAASLSRATWRAPRDFGRNMCGRVEGSGPRATAPRAREVTNEGSKANPRRPRRVARRCRRPATRVGRVGGGRAAGSARRPPGRQPRGFNLWGADLRGADLGVADLRGADLGVADLGRANLRGATGFDPSPLWRLLQQRGACGDALAWLLEVPADAPLASVWGCARPDWREWIAEQFYVPCEYEAVRDAIVPLLCATGAGGDDG